MDNMTAHHCRAAKEALDRLNILPIFNVPYSPQFNGIESVFSMLKFCYKRLLLRSIMKNERLQPKKLIEAAI